MTQIPAGVTIQQLGTLHTAVEWFHVIGCDLSCILRDTNGVEWVVLYDPDTDTGTFRHLVNPADLNRSAHHPGGTQ